MKKIFFTFFLFGVFLCANAQHSYIIWEDTFAIQVGSCLPSTHNWSVTSLGAQGSYANEWYISSPENCDTTSTCSIIHQQSNTTGALYIGYGRDSSNLSSCDSSLAGAVYRKECNNLTHRRVASPVINCSGHSGVKIEFDFMGRNRVDDSAYCKLVYSIDGGTNWLTLQNRLHSFHCWNGSGFWTHATYTLPNTVNNNPNLKIGFEWYNGEDCLGFNPSFAVDNIVLHDVLFVTTTVVRSTCFDYDNGSVTANVSGEFPPYSYNWLGFSNSNTPILTPVGAGIYTVIVTDNMGNTSSVSDTLIETPQVIVTVTPGIIQCYNGSTCVTVTAIGGTPGYAGTGVFCGKGAGVHTFGATDINKCYDIKTITITQPSIIAISTSTTSACGSNSGTATATPSGGTPAYTYSWYPGGQTTQTATNLVAGSYVVTVTDANGCTMTASVTIVNFGALTNKTSLEINGPASICVNQNALYTIAPVEGASSYNWTLPSGSTGTSYKPSIDVEFGKSFRSGNISVQVSCPCCFSSVVKKYISSVSPPSTLPGEIRGPNSICRESPETFSIDTISSVTNYIWITSENLTIVSGQGTNSIVVDSKNGYSGKIKVKYSNCSGESKSRVVNINKCK